MHIVVDSWSAFLHTRMLCLLHAHWCRGCSYIDYYLQLISNVIAKLWGIRREQASFPCTSLLSIFRNLSSWCICKYLFKICKYFVNIFVNMFKKYLKIILDRFFVNTVLTQLKRKELQRTYPPASLWLLSNRNLVYLATILVPCSWWQLYGIHNNSKKNIW